MRLEELIDEDWVREDTAERVRGLPLPDDALPRGSTTGTTVPSSFAPRTTSACAASCSMPSARRSSSCAGPARSATTSGSGSAATSISRTSGSTSEPTGRPGDEFRRESSYRSTTRSRGSPWPDTVRTAPPGRAASGDHALRRGPRLGEDVLRRCLRTSRGVRGRRLCRLPFRRNDGQPVEGRGGARPDRTRESVGATPDRASS